MRPFQIVNTGTPWWGTLLIAVGGALVGGLFALGVGVVNGRREVLRDRAQRLTGLYLEIIRRGQEVRLNLRKNRNNEDRVFTFENKVIAAHLYVMRDNLITATTIVPYRDNWWLAGQQIELMIDTVNDLGKFVKQNKSDPSEKKTSTLFAILETTDRTIRDAIWQLRNEITILASLSPRAVRRYLDGPRTAPRKIVRLLIELRGQNLPAGYDENKPH